MFAGLVNSLVLSPIELVKCRMQIQTEKSLADAYYKSSMHCFGRILREEGVSNGLMKGLVATVSREVPCYAGQFGGYFLAKRLWAEYIQKCDVTQVNTLGCFIAGGVGGFTCWFVSYPQDIIKTKL